MRSILYLAAAVVFVACTSQTGSNPFDVPPGEEPGANLTGFAEIHERILEPKCANPACHDGTFEPDFRTIEGSYNTLVYHPVVKNDEDRSYEYRVVPGEVEQSWLYNRLVTSNDTLGQMPLYGEPLSNQEIKQITSWIEQGAKGTDGTVPLPPNEVPNFNWYVAFSGDVNWSNWDMNRIDETRTEWAAPFSADASDTIRLLLHMGDDLLPTSNLQNVVIYSGPHDDYSQMTANPATYFVGDYWTVSFAPNTFDAGDTTYFRVQFSDDASTISSPDQESPWWYVDHCSFYLF